MLRWLFRQRSSSAIRWLAEARAAVEAASHEGQGRRKKRKEKREAEARERAELEALEKGLDPTLVLDDSVVEVAQGSTVAQFAELLEVSPNDILKLACSCWVRHSRSPRP